VAEHLQNRTAEELSAALARHTDLGHAKRDRAFLRQVSLACGSPGASTPRRAGRSSGNGAWADAMATYRFVGNDAVDIGQLRAGRAGTVLETVEPNADVLIVHDVSELHYCSHTSKQDRRLVGDHRELGYEYVCCLAVDPCSGSSLGVVHDCLVNCDGPDDWREMDYDYEPLFEHFSPEEYKRLTENHRHQMAVHIRGLAPMLSEYHPIHVADCEFDDIFLMDTARQEGQDFVLRNRLARSVQVPPYKWISQEALNRKQTGHPAPSGYLHVNLQRLLPDVPTQPYKMLPVDAKNRVVDSRIADRFASLCIGSFRVRLYRRAKRNKQYFSTPRAVELNVVLIRETEAPSGTEPICWVLLTSLPVDTYEQMAYVARIYELRWNIEDFFKLLKSGYRILQSQLDSGAKLARHLVVITLAAMAITTLKRELNLPKKGPLDDENYKRIKNAMLNPNDPNTDLRLALFATMARKGGWLGRRRDTIGPTILMRGALDMLSTLHDMVELRDLFTKALDHPEVLQQLFGI